ncbi:hypothetical protein [Gracilibacillus alcaliphilus]|uniref:hypothetical protein n=1 Tax=Gracilibacillus alcaliphilus TaxID=1401441 RepID=UPI00195DAC7B|nr:hypothetical protein [Gracilibacillus alcaliphilus]MBM7678949.1 DNA-directed RNA polymerase subunit RPC12/RpoP [Gracilibacillus alcaliphilus]
MIEIKLKNAERHVHMKFTEDNVRVGEGLLQSVLNFIGHPEKIQVNDSLKIVKENHSIVTKPINYVTDQAKNGTGQDENRTVQGKSRPRRLPLVNSDRSNFSLGDLIQNQRKERESVQTECKCPECGHEGLKYVPFGYRYTFCDICNTKLFIKPAAVEWGEKDETGNVYVADEVYEVG